MATNVTLTSYYRNPDHFQEKNTPIYAYGGLSSRPSSSLSWLGSTVNAIGTYVDAQTIKAEENLRFDGSLLQLGDIAEPSIGQWGSSDFVAMIGSNDVTEYGGVEIVGSQTSINERVGEILFINAAADQAIGELYVTRDAADDRGKLFAAVTDSDGNMQVAWEVDINEQGWYIAGSQSLGLTSTVFSSWNSVNLGSPASRWPSGWFTDLYVGALSTKYGAADHTIAVGDAAGTGYGGIEIIGNQTTNAYVGAVSFHNVQAAAANKKVAQISASRYGDHDAGELNFHIADSDGNLEEIYSAIDGTHSWQIAGTEHMKLQANTLTVGGAATTSQINLDNTSSYNWWIKSDEDTSMTFGYFSDTMLTLTSTAFTLDGLTLNFTDGNTYIGEDSAGNLIFYDANVGYPVELGEMVGGYWDRTGTDLSPTNAGDDILLASSTEAIKWGDGDTYIYEDGDDNLKIAVGGAVTFGFYATFNYTVLDFVPAADTTYDLGSDSLYWKDLYVDNRIYIDNAGGIYISTAGGEMAFTDGMNGTLSLSDLESPWSRSGTDISPATAGDDILLAVSSEHIKWGDGDTYIVENADDELYFYTGGTNAFRLENSFVVCNRDTIPLSTSTFDLGSNAAYWAELYVDLIYIDDTNTYISQDSAGNMIFYDTNVGYPVELSELVAGAGYWDRTGTDLSPINAGDDILLDVTNGLLKWGDGDTYFQESTDDVLRLYTAGGLRMEFDASAISVYTNFEPESNKSRNVGGSSVFFDNAYFDRVYIDNTNTYIDVSGSDMLLVSADAGSVALADLVAGAGYWDRSGTDLSPANAGDDIVLATSTERILFGDKDTRIFESSDDVISIECSSSSSATFYSTGTQTKTVWSYTTKTYDLGSSTYWWRYLYVDRVYIDNSSTYLDISSSEISFTDAVNGTVVLSDLVNVVTSFTGDTNNQVLTASGSGGIIGEANLTFTSNVLTIDSATTTSALNLHNSATGSYAFAISTDGSTSLDIERYTTMFIQCMAADGSIRMPNLNNSNESDTVEYDSATGELTYYTQSSDLRLKENLRRIEKPMSKIMKLSGYFFNFNELAQKEFGARDHIQAGMIAQDVQKVFPEVVCEYRKWEYGGDDESPAKKIEYAQLAPILLEGLKELQNEIDVIKRHLNL